MGKVEVLYIGVNVTEPMPPPTGSIWYKYQYIRKINGLTQSSFSNDLEELKQRMKCELESE